MAIEISNSKFALKTSCVHFANGMCKILNSTQTGKLNCELHKCSFFETTAEYQRRQAKFNERGASELKKAAEIK